MRSFDAGGTSGRRAHLAGFKARLHADAYAAFNGVYANARRAAGRTCGASFTTSSRPMDRNSPPRRWRAAGRCTGSRKRSAAARPAGAIGYALGRWPALVRYVDDGELVIDNNAAERASRAVALGRENCPLAGSDAGGERAAATYSLIGTAKLHAVDPKAYYRLTMVFISALR